MTKAKLDNYINKEVSIITKNGVRVDGIVYRYYRDCNTCKDGDYEYYVGYDGGFMEKVCPSKIQSIKVI